MIAACIAAVVTALLCPEIVSADNSTVAIFERLKPSLAIVQSEAGGAVAMGTAFCVASDSSRSYFLTNNHVLIGDTVHLRLQIDLSTYPARIVRRAMPPLDAAVIEVDRGNIPAVVLAPDLPGAGTLIAVAGYPSFHLTSDLEPSIHLGSVNSIMDGGEILEHDALTDHGNSGGPLFDRDTGVVYGINSALVPSRTAKEIVNFIAFAISDVLPFLDNAKVAYALAGHPAGTTSQPPSNSAILAETSAAFRVAYLAPDAQQVGAAPIKAAVDSHITEEAGNLLGSQMIAVPLTGVDLTSIGAAVNDICQAQDVNAILLTVYTWSAQIKAPSDHVTADVEMGLSDCHADAVFTDKSHKEADYTVSNPSDITAAYVSTVTSATDEILNQWRSIIVTNPTAIVNLVRYGFAISTGQRTSGVVLSPGKQGAIVTAIASVGPAEIAGLRRFDVITKINGEALAGLSQEQLNAVIAKVEGNDGKYNVDILRADGKTVAIEYQSEGIGWYLKQPVLSNSAAKKTFGGAQNAAFEQTIGGTYMGPVQDANEGNGTLQLSLIQRNGAISGTWGTTFDKQQSNGFGTLWGSATNGRLTATLKPSTGGSQCVITLSGMLTKDAISGSYRSDSCAARMNGTFQIRQETAVAPNIAGAYSGTLSDNGAGQGTFTVTISQSGTNLSGTWAVSFPDRRLNNSGTINGVLVNGTTAQFYLDPSVAGSCLYLATAVVQDGKMKGTYASQDCVIANGGSFTANQ